MQSHRRAYLSLGTYVAKWALLVTPVAALVGSACALFLILLEWATAFRLATPWLLFCLPLAGAGISWLYTRFGTGAEGGNNLLIDAIHEYETGETKPVVARRMGPLILLTTILTHLFGGSAGREGTAVQMGGAVAAAIGEQLGLKPADMRTLLMAGIAAGFGGVFGTPLTGAVFAMEVLALGRMSYDALIPCLIAALLGDGFCRVWGIHHTHYAISTRIASTLGWADQGSLMLKVAAAGVIFGLVSMLFSEATHGLGHFFKQTIRQPMLRPVVGGSLLIGLTLLLGNQDYLGLGVSSADPHAVTIVSAFAPGGADDWSWLLKLVFTALTLGSGFKGGEVTPLFFIGASSGNVLGRWLGAPVDLFAGLGFIAVFSGATNTPLACTLMGVELFGSQYTLYFVLACFFAYLFSGHSGIYLSQRIGTPKFQSLDLPPNASLGLVREQRSNRGIRRRLDGANEKSSEDTIKKGFFMSNHRLTSREIGQLRIYLAPGERRDKSGESGFGLRRLLAGHPPLYTELIQLARQEGLLHATAHHSHYGYSSGGEIQANIQELPNPRLTMCVELIGPRAQLEQFCRKHGALLQNKVVVYKHMEHWDIEGHQLQTSDLKEEDYDEPSGF